MSGNFIAGSPTASPISDAHLANAQQVIAYIEQVFQSRIVGQENLRKSLIICLLTGGHILLESMPGEYICQSCTN